MFIFFAFIRCADAQVVSLVTGIPDDSGGMIDGPLNEAKFKYPSSVTVITEAGDFSGVLVVTDSGNNRVRLVTASAVSTLAGSGSGFLDGTGTNAQFNSPWCTLVVEATASSFTLIVADRNNRALRRVTQDGNVTLFAGGSEGFVDGVGTNAKFSGLRSLSLNDGVIYAADAYGIRIVTLDGAVSTLAGRQGDETSNIDGFGTAATFFKAYGVGSASIGGVHVACNDDMSQGKLRRVNASGSVTTLLSNVNIEVAAESLLDGRIFLSFSRSDYIGVYSGDSVSTFVGLPGNKGISDGEGTNARFYNPIGISRAYKGKIYVADYGNHMIRVIESIPPPSATPSPSSSASPSLSQTPPFSRLSGGAGSGAGSIDYVGLTVGICFASVFLAITLVYVVFQLRFKMATLKMISRQQGSSTSQEYVRARFDGSQQSEAEHVDARNDDPVAIDPLTTARIEALTTNNPLSSMSRSPAAESAYPRKLVLF